MCLPSALGRCCRTGKISARNSGLLDYWCRFRYGTSAVAVYLGGTMSKQLAVVAASMVVLVGAMSLKSAVTSKDSGAVLMANGGAPTPPSPWKLNGGAPTPPSPWKLNGGAPTPPSPWKKNGGAPTPPSPWKMKNGGAPTPPSPWK